MALYRFSCYGNTIDEREFHSGEDVYTHAQYLADQIGSQVDFIVMPKYDSVTPQHETESVQDGEWETETAQDDDWETESSQDDDWETDSENEQWETKSGQDRRGIGFAIAIFIGFLAGITGIVAAAAFYLSHPSILDNTKSTALLYRQATPTTIPKTKDNHLTRVRDKLMPSGIEGASSRQSIRESSATLNSRKSVGKLMDGSLFTLPSDSHKSPNRKYQRATTADLLQKMPLDTRKESPTLRVKSSVKGTPSAQWKRQKKQGGSRLEGQGNEEAIAQNQLRQTPAATAPASEKLPSGGF